MTVQICISFHITFCRKKNVYKNYINLAWYVAYYCTICGSLLSPKQYTFLSIVMKAAWLFYESSHEGIVVCPITSLMACWDKSRSSSLQSCKSPAVKYSKCLGHLNFPLIANTTSVVATFIFTSVALLLLTWVGWHLSPYHTPTTFHHDPVSTKAFSIFKYSNISFLAL